MTEEQAIKESIAHWERMRDGKRIKIVLDLEEPSSGDCALCDYEYTQKVDEHESGTRWKDPCVFCPVYEKTGLAHCSGTPYLKALMFWRAMPDKDNPTPEFKAAAQEEIGFLRKLL